MPKLFFAHFCKLFKQCIDYGFTSVQISVNIFLLSGKKFITEVFYGTPYQAFYNNNKAPPQGYEALL